MPSASTMDASQLPWPLEDLQDLLPPPLQSFLADHLFSRTSPLASLLRFLVRHLHTLGLQLVPLFDPIVDALSTFAASSPNIISAAAVITIAYLIIQVVALVRRIVLFWTRLAFRVIFWMFLGLLANALWQRGLEESLRDAVALGSRVFGFVMGVVGVWVREYEKAQEANRGYEQRVTGGRRGW